MTKLCRWLFHISLIMGYSLYGQTIKGTVSDESETVPFVTILVKAPKAPEKILQYTETDINGNYTLLISNLVDSLIIEAVSPMYEPQSFILRGIGKSRITRQDFRLESRVTELKEVIIEKRRPIVINKDTISFDPNHFKDGSERVVEDLLKKIPGVRISDNGEIRYKGKPISKLLLDNDDLFGGQYSVGSRNIDVEMVETVQAIERYNENPLLKGLIHSDQVVINLKLKRGHTDISGNFKPGYGITDKYRTSVTALAVNKKIKAFGVVSYNNTGNNSSPYNFRSSVLSLDDMNESSFLSPEVINQGSYNTILRDDYSNINDNLYGSFNSLFRLTQTLAVKTNVGIYSDRLRRYNNSLTRFFVDGEAITVQQTDHLVKKPRVYNGALQLTDKPTDDLLWEYNGTLTHRDVGYINESTNNGLTQYNNVSTENLYVKQDLSFTGRLNPSSALTGSVLFSYNAAPQTYQLSPGMNFLEELSEHILSNEQYSRFRKKVVFGKIRYLKDLKKENLLELNAGYSFVQNDINSMLSAITSEGSYTTDRYRNNISYRYEVPYLQVGVSSKPNKILKINSGLRLQYYNLKHYDYIASQEIKAAQYVLAPKFQASLELGPKYVLTASYAYDETAPKEGNVYNGIILTNYRSLVNNEPDLRFLKTHNVGINLMYENRFAQEKLGGGVNLSLRKNNYFYRTYIDTFNSISTAFLLPVGNQDVNFNLNGEKYLHFVRSTLQLESSYMLSYFKNVINESDLRNVQYRMLNLGLSIRPALQGGYNLENKLILAHSSSYLESSRQGSNTNLSDVLRFTYDNKRNFKANTALTYLIPNTTLDNDYVFLDAELTLISKSKKFEYSLIGRNLTNYKWFRTFSISDFFQSESSYNLIGRMVLAEMVFRF